MKIIFLDIDGVLNNSGAMGKLQDTHKTWWVMDSQNVEQLNLLVEQSGAHIVISSSWRHEFHDKLDELRGILNSFGFRFSDRIIDSTPRHINDERIIKLATNGIGLKLSMSIPRAWEIFEWLEHNKKIVDSFVILDDDAPINPGASHKVLRDLMKRFVRTFNRTGLTDVEVKLALQRLERPVTSQFLEQRL